MIKEFAVVRAIKNLTPKVPEGTIGAVVMVYTEPTLGYEVEFVDDHHETLEVLAVYPDSIEEVWQVIKKPDSD